MSKMYLDPRTKDRFINKDEYFELILGTEYMDSTYGGPLKGDAFLRSIGFFEEL